MTLPRPYPPEHLVGGLGCFEPAPDVLRWARHTFILEGSTVENPDHEHLRDAEIGFLWTNEPNHRRGRLILGTCQLLPPSGDKWSVARTLAQLGEWFEEIPDFLITLYAPRVTEMDDASFMALVYHELCHAGQKTDEEGQPCFNSQTGKPTWALRPHDLEEFVSVVRLFGAKACGASEFVEAANQGPLVSEARISFACGTCLKAA